MNQFSHSKNTIFTNQNIIISLLVIFSSLYYFYNYKKENIIEDLKLIEKEKKLEKPRITSKDIDKYIQREFSNVLKIFAKEVQNTAKSMSEFNHDFLLKSDYLNFRNNLFTKDIEKHHILVDSKSIEHCCNDNEDCNCTSHYTFYLNSPSNDPTTNFLTSGFGNFKNVIGFRCIRAFLPSLPWNIHENNNEIIMNVDGGANQSILLDKGLYSGGELASLITKKLNDANQIWPAGGDPPRRQQARTRNFHCIYKNAGGTARPVRPEEKLGHDGDLIVVAEATKYEKLIKNWENIPTKRFIIIFDEDDALAGGAGINYNFQFRWDLSNKSSNRLFGFIKNNITSDVNGNFGAGDGIPRHSLISNIMPDTTNHFVDLVVDEIPYIACKKNPLGKSIIERIPTDAATGGNYIEHHVSDSEYFSQNYFNPISLSQLSIKLYDDTLKNYYFTNNLDNSFVFEVTMLKNTKSLNHITHK